MNRHAQPLSIVRHLVTVGLLIILATGLLPGSPGVVHAAQGNPQFTGMATAADWTAESDQAYAWFGQAVGTAGDVNGDGYADVIIGADMYDNGETDEGRVYVYHGSASGLSTTPAWTMENNQAGSEFGYAAAAAGDVNGDGYDDVIVGAKWAGTDYEGRAYVYHGSASGLSTTPAWTAESNQADAEFGHAVGTAGDVNGDGFDDVIVGAYGYSTDPEEPDFKGRAYVYYGSASGLSASANWTMTGGQENAQFGWSVGTAGDVNNDEYDDVIIGAACYANTLACEGAAFVYHGSPAGLSTTFNWKAEGNKANVYFGYAVGTAGDVNGDGYDDVIVGAPDYFSTSTQPAEGRAFVYYGSAAGLGTTPWTAESNQSYAGLGISVGAAGDVNKDGFADIIVGAYAYDAGQIDEGRAFMWHGSSTGLGAAGTPTNADWSAESDQAGAYFGWSAGTAGDVNGDGADDIIIGAYAFDNGQTDEGRAFGYYGSGCGPAVAPVVTAALSGDDVVLSWSASSANAQYEVWISTNPYLDPANPGGVTPLYTTLTSHPDAGAAASLENHFYVVRGVNACGAPSASSNRMGEFTFGLIRGD